MLAEQSSGVRTAMNVMLEAAAITGGAITEGAREGAVNMDLPWQGREGTII